MATHRWGSHVGSALGDGLAIVVRRFMYEGMPIPPSKVTKI